MKRVLLAGSVTYDRIMDFKGLFKDNFIAEALHNINLSFMVDTPKIGFGGCAGNIAYSLALLSQPSDLMESVGNDFAPYQAWLEKHGIGTDTLQVIDDMPSSSVFVITDTANNQIAAFSPASSSRPYTKTIETSRYVLAVVSPTATETMMLAATTARDAKLPYFFDPGQQLPSLTPDELRTGIAGATALLVNDYELSLIQEKTGWSERDIVEKLQFLVVTYGAEGSRIVTKDSNENLPAVLVPAIVDPTGAGDAYRSGFVVGYLAKLPLTTCAKIGSVVAAYAVECYGTQNHSFTRDEVATRYEQTYQEPFPLKP